MRHDNRKLIVASEDRNGVRPEEVEIHEGPEEVFPPAVTIEEQRIPSGLGHQTQKLAASFAVNHAGVNSNATIAPPRGPNMNKRIAWIVAIVLFVCALPRIGASPR